jgi:hypothetical protein
VFVFSSEEPVKFPLYLRIPRWCMEGIISINGKNWSTQEGNQIVKIDRQWRDGDMVELKLSMEVQTSRWHENFVSIEMGPLVYSLRIRGNWQKVNGSDKYGSYYEVYPLESWNYGIIDEAVKEPKKYFRIIKNGLSELYPWNIDNAPIQIEVMGKKIPEWKEYNKVAGPLPHSPIHSDQPLNKIILIPYGCSTLRISEFPVVR